MFEQFLRDQHMLAAAAATSPVEFEAVWVRSEVKAPAVRHRYQLSGGGISTTIHVETVKEGEEWKVDYLGE
jgi:hypothetical protein